MKLLAILAPIGSIFIYTVFTACSLWLMLSVTSSIMKRAVNECGTTYGIEDFKVNGNFFCKK